MGQRHSQRQQGAASDLSGSPPADYNADALEATKEAGGETADPAEVPEHTRDRGAKHLNHGLTSAQTDHRANDGRAGATDHAHPAAVDHPTTAGGLAALDLQEGEAGESTPNLAGSSRVPAGHMDHGLPAEGLRIHNDPGVTEGVTEAVAGSTVSGRAAPNAANASQALNKKVLFLYLFAKACTQERPGSDSISVLHLNSG